MHFIERCDENEDSDSDTLDNAHSIDDDTSDFTDSEEKLAKKPLKEIPEQQVEMPEP